MWRYSYKWRCMKCYKIYSFDIFDTCLIRTCGIPVLAFDLLAERILGREVSETLLMDFSNIRKNGEKDARKKYVTKDKEDITLEEIYQECDFSPVTEIDKNTIMAQELELERELLKPVPSVLHQIEELRQQGHHIIYISDMYLSEEFLTDVMSHAGFFKPGDKLYVSSKWGKGKWTGSLFKLVAEREQIDTRKWLHQGDNLYADVKVPKSLGIDAKRLFHPYTHEEHLMGAFNLTSGIFHGKICASFCRYLRLSCDERPETRFAIELIAPLYVSFTSWILQDAKQRGIKRLYFLARDGEILYETAKTLQPYYPDMELHYLYVSRKSLYLPGIQKLTKKEINERVIVEKTLKNILDCFQLDEEFNRFNKYEDLHDDELIDSLLADSDFVSIFDAKQRMQRELCLKYFEDEGLSHGDAAIVDLNGGRRSHKAINKILSLGGYEEAFGYYFMVVYDRIAGKDYKAFNFGERFELNRYMYRMLHTLVFEEYFSMSDHETTISYKKENDHVVHVLGTGKISSERRKDVFNINREVCSRYAELYAKYVPLNDSEHLCKTAYGVVSDFFDAPDRKLLSVFEDMTFSFTSLVETSLLQKVSFWKLLMRKDDGMWFSGNLVYNAPFPKLVTGVLRLVRFFRVFRQTYV